MNNLARLGEGLMLFSLGVLTTLIFTGAGSPLAWPVFGVTAAAGFVVSVIGNWPQEGRRDEDHQAVPVRGYGDQEYRMCELCGHPIRKSRAVDGEWEHGE